MAGRLTAPPPGHPVKGKPAIEWLVTTKSGPNDWENNMGERATLDHLIALASHEDSLLQSYRNIFLMSESILLVPALSVSGNNIWAISTCMLGIIVAISWMYICDDRGISVWFFQWKIRQKEAGQDVIDPFSDFIVFKREGEKGISKMKTDSLGKEFFEYPRRLGPRCILDKFLPCAFMILFGAIAVTKLACHDDNFYHLTP